MSSAMNDWSKIVDPKKLVLGISSNSIIELTVPIKEIDLSFNSTVPRDINSTIPSTNFMKDNNLNTYTDRCTFKEDYSLRVSSCLEMRSVDDGPLSGSCTANSSSNWTRKFDIGSNVTYLYSVVDSSEPLSRYYYVTYEDYQSIQYKFKLIIDNSYGGISLSPLTDGCDDLVNAVTSIFPITRYSPPLYDSTGFPSNSNSDTITVIGIVIPIVVVVFIFCIIICCHCCHIHNYNNNNVGRYNNNNVGRVVAVQYDRYGNVIAGAVYAR